LISLTLAILTILGNETALPLLRGGEHLLYSNAGWGSLFLIYARGLLDADRKQKAPLYAEGGITDYWILDVNQRQLYIFREPGLETYNLEFILPEDATLSLIAFPEIQVQINQLFP
jgi:hypothetical protein